MTIWGGEGHTGGRCDGSQVRGTYGEGTGNNGGAGQRGPKKKKKGERSRLESDEKDCEKPKSRDVFAGSQEGIKIGRESDKTCGKRSN